jgi:hypothetical protein
MVAPGLHRPESSTAACMFRPELPPVSRPSSRLKRRHMSKHCLSVTDSIASTTSKFIVPGTESFPTPSTLYLPAAKTPRSTGLPSPWYAPYITEPTGSGIRTLTLFLDASFKNLPVPETGSPRCFRPR